MKLKKGVYSRRAARPNTAARPAPETATWLPAPLKARVDGVAETTGEPVPVLGGATEVLLANTGGGTTTTELTGGGITTTELTGGGTTTAVLTLGAGGGVVILGADTLLTTTGGGTTTALVETATGVGMETLTDEVYTGTGLVTVQGQLVMVMVVACKFRCQ